ncbi:MAG: DUF885 family protein, partial [Candidatus Kariarchaeaceae archaeon]
MTLIDTIVQRYKDANPVWSFYTGFHEYDGVPPDYDQGRINARIEEIKADMAALEAQGEPEEKTAKFNHNLVLRALDSELFGKSVYREFTKSPMPYLFPLNAIEATYAARSFASVDSRINSIISVQEGIPKLLDQARTNLMPELARPKVKRGIQFIKGLVSYFGDTLIGFIVQATDEAVIEKWSQVNATAIEALEAFGKELEEVYLPKCHDNYQLGEDVFLQLLEKTQDVK